MESIRELAGRGERRGDPALAKRIPAVRRNPGAPVKIADLRHLQFRPTSAPSP
ncbi:MAG TPA: hypothetical protein VN775_09135 [Opitutaceae bacterium]|nr:hypothetical protein [Opitutaceae bacterium]